MPGSEIKMTKASLWEVPKGFRCSKPEFAEYLDIDGSAQYSCPRACP